MRVAVAWRDTARGCVEVWHTCDVSTSAPIDLAQAKQNMLSYKRYISEDGMMRDEDMHRLLARAGAGLRWLALHNNVRTPIRTPLRCNS